MCMERAGSMPRVHSTHQEAPRVERGWVRGVVAAPSRGLFPGLVWECGSGAFQMRKVR